LLRDPAGRFLACPLADEALLGRAADNADASLCSKTTTGQGRPPRLKPGWFNPKICVQIRRPAGNRRLPWPTHSPDDIQYDVTNRKIPMRRKLIVSLLGVGAAFALALAFGAQAPSVDTKVDAFACRLIIQDGKYKTICAQQ
jgi:hypothetical protein